MENIVPILVGLLFAGMIIWVIIYQTMKFMRGSLKLTLPRTAFNPGETITGAFELTTKQAVEGEKVTAAIIGTEVTRYYHTGRSRIRKREVYRDETLLEQARQFQPGETQHFEFSIQSPDPNSGQVQSSPLGEMLRTGLQILSGRQTFLRWRIEARLYAKGVDLIDRQKITINL